MNPRIRQTPSGHWVLVSDSHVSTWIEEHGSLFHDHQTLPLFLENIQPGDAVVDIGGFVGDTAAPFLERVGPTGCVFVMEPNPDAYECLVRNLAPLDKHKNIFTKNAAAGGTEGVATLMIQENAGASFLGESGVTVPVVSLDSMKIDRCDFLKLDTEGTELNVLKGAEETITKFRPKLAIEINETALGRQGTSGAEVFAWLHNHGYQFWPLVPPDRNQPSPQYDILCRPMERGDVECRRTNFIARDASAINASNGAAKFEPSAAPVVPWRDPLESTERVRALCAELRGFCGAPAYTGLVRRELKAHRVIPTVKQHRKKRARKSS